MSSMKLNIGGVVRGSLLALLAGGAGLQAEAPAETTGITYRGQAAVVTATGAAAPPDGALTIGDTGPLPETGGNLEVSLEDVAAADGDLRIEVARAASWSDGRAARAEASLTNLELTLRPAGGEATTLRAGFLGSVAAAKLDRKAGTKVSGKVEAEEVELNGEEVEVTGRRNQEVTFPGGRIVFNEQVPDPDAEPGSVAVVAMHVIVDGGLDAMFGLAHAGVARDETEPEPPAEVVDRIAGGGWITGTPGGGKGLFAVSGQDRDGVQRGLLFYCDRDTGLRVRSTALTGFATEAEDPACRVLTFEVLIDGEPGTAEVRACDGGRGGSEDTFAITLSTGYAASGQLGGEGGGGGNIRLNAGPAWWWRGGHHDDDEDDEEEEDDEDGFRDGDRRHGGRGDWKGPESGRRHKGRPGSG